MDLCSRTRLAVWPKQEVSVSANVGPVQAPSHQAGALQGRLLRTLAVELPAMLGFLAVNIGEILPLSGCLEIQLLDFLSLK